MVKTLTILTLSILLSYLWMVIPYAVWHPFALTDIEITSHWYINLLVYKMRFVLLVWLLYLNVNGILKLIVSIFLIFYGLNVVDYLLFYDNSLPVYSFIFKIALATLLIFLLNYENRTFIHPNGNNPSR